ncbi:MAG: hypothetical protein GSR84_07435 [Desulfurococcales archaeon]|nr:hypothetical protein [Desulfurococcales archaeon]
MAKGEARGGLAGMRPVLLYSKIRLHWGFITRVPGASAAQPAYPLPPPTTVVGAYANPLARLVGEPDSLYTGLAGGPPRGRRRPRLMPRILKCSFEATLGAGAGLSGLVGVASIEEPSRILAGPYKGGGSYEKAVRSPPYIGVQEVMPVQAMGHAIAPGAMIEMAWLLDADRLSACLGVGEEKLVGILELVAWSVYRVGSREGLASVVDARVYGEPRIGEGVFNSILYQRADCATPEMGGTIEVTLNDIHYVEALYHVPARGSVGALAPGDPVTFTTQPSCKYATVDGVGLAFRG